MRGDSDLNVLGWSDEDSGPIVEVHPGDRRAILPDGTVKAVE